MDIAIDQGEKKLLQTATKGVVRLFNAVSKAQRDAVGKTIQRSKVKAGPASLTLVHSTTFSASQLGRRC